MDICMYVVTSVCMCVCMHIRIYLRLHLAHVYQISPDVRDAAGFGWWFVVGCIVIVGAN